MVMGHLDEIERLLGCCFGHDTCGRVKRDSERDTEGGGGRGSFQGRGDGFWKKSRINVGHVIPETCGDTTFVTTGPSRGETGGSVNRKTGNGGGNETGFQVMTSPDTSSLDGFVLGLDLGFSDLDIRHFRPGQSYPK